MPFSFMACGTSLCHERDRLISISHIINCEGLLVVKWVEFAIVLNFLFPEFFQERLWWLGMIPSIAKWVLGVGYIYLNMVAMRMVGLFYRHGKEHFPWAAE